MTRSVPASMRSSHATLHHAPSDSADEGSAPETTLPIRSRSVDKSGIPLAVKHAGPNNQFRPRKFAKPFCKFLTQNPTVFHAAAAIAEDLTAAGYTRLSPRDLWTLEAGGKYFVERNGSSLIAFAVGKDYKPGNGIAMIAGHIDALTAKVKPMPKLDTKEGYIQLGVAPYAGALNGTWWDRDLAIAGRVLVKDESGKIITKLVNIAEPIARIPTLAPHFGAPAVGPFNLETQMVPIIGLDNSDVASGPNNKPQKDSVGAVGTFASTQPPRLVKAVASVLKTQDFNSIINWELELYDSQPAQLGGLDKEFIYGGRIDDKLCSWSAIQALLGSTYEAPLDPEFPSNDGASTEDNGIIKLVGVFDDEEIGSLLRQGARGNFLPSTIERIVDCFASSSRSSSSSSKQASMPHQSRTQPTPHSGANILSQTYANSFLISADVTHAVNPNFLSAYLPHHSPRLNIGVVVSADSNGHMTTDAVSTAFLQRVAEKCESTLQVFQIRNDVRSGGTVGPMLSSAMGCRAIDAGIPQLSMHSIRATTGALDPGLGVKLFKGFFDHFEEVDGEFR